MQQAAGDVGDWLGQRLPRQDAALPIVDTPRRLDPALPVAQGGQRLATPPSYQGIADTAGAIKDAASSYIPDPPPTINGDALRKGVEGIAGKVTSWDRLPQASSPRGFVPGASTADLVTNTQAPPAKTPVGTTGIGAPGRTPTDVQGTPMTSTVEGVGEIKWIVDPADGKTVRGMYDPRGNLIPIPSGTSDEDLKEIIARHFPEATEAAAGATPTTAPTTGDTIPTPGVTPATSSSPGRSFNPGGSSNRGYTKTDRSSGRTSSGPSSAPEDDDTVDGKTLDDFIKEAAGDGPITSVARAKGKRAFLAAKARRGSRSTMPRREDTPLRTQILATLAASLNKNKKP